MGYINKIFSNFDFKDKFIIFFLFILIFLSMILEMIGIAMIIPIIALLSSSNLLELFEKFPFLKDYLSPFYDLSPHQLLIYLMIFLILIYVIKNVLLFLFSWWKYLFTFNIQKKFTDLIFKYYLQRDYLFHIKHNSSELIRNVNNVSIFAEIINQLLYIATEFFILTGILIILLSIEPLGTVLVFGFLLFFSGLFYLFANNRLKFYGNLRQLHDKKRLQNMQESFGGLRIIKLLGKEKEFAKKFKIHNDNFVDVSRFFEILQTLPKLWLEILAVTSLSIITIFMAFYYRDIGIIIPVIGIFAASGFKILPSVNRVINSSNYLFFYLPVVNSLSEELNKIEINNQNNDDSIDKILHFSNSIFLDSISFSYPNNEKKILDNASLKIDKNEFVGIIGPSGEGKSTLVDIISSLIEPDQGKILVDGNEIKDAKKNWQQNIGYVPQSVFLIDDTIIKNIALGIDEKNIDQEKIKNCLNTCQLTDFVNSLDKGVHSFVGERGVNLSGGQIQRIGIARALYNNPQILILDEATSSLDISTEKRIIDTLEKLKGKITIIIVTHRLSTIVNCDKIYKLLQSKLILD